MGGDKKYWLIEQQEDSGKPFKADEIVEFILGCETENKDPHYKSEPIPEHQPSHDIIQPVVGKNLQEMVFTQNKDVFFQISAPWCGHSAKMRPELDKLGRKIRKDEFTDIM